MLFILLINAVPQYCITRVCCLFQVLLRVGGHQLCVQNGNVAIVQGKKPSISTLVSFPKIPAASVLVRILPHSVVSSNQSLLITF